jgi:hypothetical protein
MKQCLKCGQSFTDDNSFCLHDGAVLSQVVVSPNMLPTQVVSSPKIEQPISPGIRMTYVGLIVLLIAVVSCAGYVMYSNFAAPGDARYQTIRVSNNKNSDRVDTGPSPELPPPSKSLISNPVTPMTASPSGQWSGNWSSSSGAYLKFDLSLNESGGKADGQINWTLIRTTRPDKINKIGSTATEYVSGRFDPATRQVTLGGYRKDDPNNMLVMLDQYRLNLAADGRTLRGSARNGGKWNARVDLAR